MANQCAALLAVMACLIPGRALAQLDVGQTNIGPTNATQTDIVQPTANQPASADSVTLDRAISLAAHYNQQVSISRQEIRKSEKLIAAARTQGLPQFRAVALPGQEIAQPLQGNYAVLGVAAQPLTQLYRVGLSEHLAKLERSSAREGVRLSLQETVNTVKQTYYAIIQRAIAIQSVEEQIKFLRS